jgi:SRSO17 transposase
MNLRSKGDADARFSAYRIGPLRDYCTGLILPGERKSVEPMAAKTAAGHNVSAIMGGARTKAVQRS